jgi:hypothetical protein
MRYSTCLGGGVLVAMLGLAAASQAGPIDLNDFFADPAVTVAPDGASAVIAEDPDPSVDFVLLVNDPGLGDPNVITPGPGVVLAFDYVLATGLGDLEAFSAFVLDAATGLSAGPAYEFFTEIAASGTLSFDLSALTGSTLGLQFSLESLVGDAAAATTVTVSDLRLTQAQVPAPSVPVLMLIGLAGAGLARRRRFNLRSGTALSGRRDRPTRANSPVAAA